MSIEAHERGWSMIREKLRQPKLPEGKSFQDLIRDLLTDRVNTEPSPDRQNALDYLYEGVYSAAQIATDDLDIHEGFSENRLPPVESSNLVKTGIINDWDTIVQIAKRVEAREQRQKGPPESRLSIKALTKEEIAKLPEEVQKLQKPIIRIIESYTVTNEVHRNIEANMLANFVLGKRESGKPDIYFLGEAQHIHAHMFLGNEWLRVDQTNFSDFRVPTGKRFTEPKQPIPPYAATNQHLAILLVLFEYSSSKAKK